MPQKKELTKDDYIKADIQDICETMRLMSKTDNGADLLHTLSVVANFLYESEDIKTAAKCHVKKKHGNCEIDIKFNIKGE